MSQTFFSIFPFLLENVLQRGWREIRIVTIRLSKLLYLNNPVACTINIPYFIEYIVHTSIVRTWISQWFLVKKVFLFFKNNFTRFNYCKFIPHKGHLNPFLSYLPCIVCTEYFSIIFNAKKCALYSIKYSIIVWNFIEDDSTSYHLFAILIHLLQVRFSRGSNKVSVLKSVYTSYK